jgi:hypothetical protein
MGNVLIGNHGSGAASLQVVAEKQAQSAKCLEKQAEGKTSPWSMDPYHSSGFTVKTQVKQSSIPGAGQARFVMEAVTKGQIVRVTTLVGPQQTPLVAGSTFVCDSPELLQRCLDFEDAPEKPTNKEQIVNFGGTPFNVPEDNQASFYWIPCNYFNHSGEPNVVIALSPMQDGKVYIVALRDIKPGEEFFQDYRSFTLPKWYMSLCSEWKLASTEDLGYAISADSNFQKGTEDIESVRWPDLKSTDVFHGAYISDIPWAMNPFFESGFTVKTQIKKSNIPQAGRARFLMEPVKRGAIVRVTKLVRPDQGHPAPGSTLVCDETQKLLECMDYVNVKGFPCTREQIVNFAGTPFNVPENNQASFYWIPCNYFNHSGDPNVVLALPPIHDGRVYIVALRDIDAGEELFQDYRSFSLPTWFRELSSDWQLTTTEDLGYLVSGKEDFSKGTEDVSCVQWPSQA